MALLMTELLLKFLLLKLLQSSFLAAAAAASITAAAVIVVIVAALPASVVVTAVALFAAADVSIVTDADFTNVYNPLAACRIHSLEFTNFFIAITFFDVLIHNNTTSNSYQICEYRKTPTTTISFSGLNSALDPKEMLGIYLMAQNL